MEDARILFAPGGAEVNSMVLQYARQATGRFKTISFWEAFHGGTLDTISIGGEAMFRSGSGPLMPGAIHVSSWGTSIDLGRECRAHRIRDGTRRGYRGVYCGTDSVHEPKIVVSVRIV